MSDDNALTVSVELNGRPFELGRVEVVRAPAAAESAEPDQAVLEELAAKAELEEIRQDVIEYQQREVMWWEV